MGGVGSIIDGSYLDESKKQVVEDNQEPIVKTTIEDKSDEVVPAVIVDEQKTDFNNDSVLAYINKDREDKFGSFEDMFKQPESKEVIKEVNPWEDILDDSDKTYFQFKKDTGLSRKEFDFVQQDISTKSSLELAHQKIKKDNPGSNFSKEEINNYLERKLSIDLTSDEIDSTDQMELNSFVKDYKYNLVSQQEKYKTTERPKNQESNVEMVTLQNGEQMPKTKYEALVNQNNEYKRNLQEGVSSATSFESEFAFDNNGEKQTSKLSYEYSEADKHSMLSNASDVDSFISKKFRTEKGFDHKGLAQFIDRAENSDKYLALAFNQGRAEALEEKIASDNNEQFTRNPRVENPNKNTAKSILDLVPNSY